VSNLLLNNCLFKLTGFYFYLQTAIGTIMWQKVGISSFVGIGTLLIIVLPGQKTLSFLNLKLRTMIAPLTDRRVQLMSELIAGIQVMKMYACKKPFSNMTYEMSTYFNILQLVVALYFPQGLILLGESIVSFNRLEINYHDFLLMDEVKSQKPKEKSNAENQIDRYISRLFEHQRLSDLPVYVKLQRVSANWISGQLPTICNINLTIKPGQLCAVVGAVDSGKSSILHLLLKELNPGSGSIILTQSLKYNFPGNLSGYFTNNPNLRISYASQEPWLFGGTVRDTVLFGQSYDKARYMQIIFMMKFKYLLFVKMQGNYNELVQSNKDFIEMLDSLNQAHRKEEENMRRASEMSKRITITKRISRLSITSSITHLDIDDIPKAEMAHGRVAGRVYKEYLHNSGNNFTLFVLLMIFIISQVATTGNDYWLSYWTTLEDVRRIENISDVKQFANMYNDSFLGSIFTLNPDGLLSIVDAIYVYTFCIVSMNSSSNLHNIMFFKLLQARMSFFHNNPSGEILNSFSKDMGIMDELLSKLMLEAIQGFCVVCGIMIMEAIINQWMLILIAVLIILFFFATKSYPEDGQDLNRLEGVMKNPIFSYVNATLNGLPTIRSSGIEIEKLMRKRFDELQDRHSGTWYLFLTCAVAFAIIADLIIFLFVACICFSLIPMNETGSVTGNKAGLAISQSLIVCLQYTIKQFSESLLLIIFVERILQYTNLPKEEPITSDNLPPSTWPSQG
ncbi:MRP4 protein, partial [Acromyrmex insinuator]